MPTSIMHDEPRSSRRSRIRAISATASSGVLRRFARLCAWLADSGSSIRSAPASIARSAPLRFGTSTETVSPAATSRTRRAPRCRQAEAGAAAGRTSRPRSRASPASKPPRNHSCFCAVGIVRARLCRPSRRPTSRMLTMGATVGHDGFRGSGGCDRRRGRPLARPSLHRPALF